MAKTSGIGWTTATVADSGGVARDIRNDVSTVELSTPREEWEITGIDKSAKERTLLLADMSVKFAGFFNPGTNAAHDVFKTVCSTTVARATALTVAGKSISGNLVYPNYPLKRDSSGKLTFDVEGMLADGNTPVWS